MKQFYHDLFTLNDLSMMVKYWYVFVFVVLFMATIPLFFTVLNLVHRIAILSDITEIIVNDIVNVTGRGLVLVLSLKENNKTIDYFKVGQAVRHNGKSYQIIGVECSRTGDSISDSVGLNVRCIKIKDGKNA